MSTYDQWKCSDPSQEGPVCPKCGGWLYRDLGYRQSWTCDDCDYEDNGPDPDYAGEERA